MVEHAVGIREGMTADEILAAVFMSQIRNSRELQPIIRGDRKAIVAGLLNAAHADPVRPASARDVTRATVVNAWTRYAHEGQGDLWVADGIERAAAGMLNPGRWNLQAS